MVRTIEYPLLGRRGDPTAVERLIPSADRVIPRATAR